jgi:membrane associated rhomboid family serine protease
MGYRDYPAQKKISLWSDNNALMMLIIINIIVFIILHFIKTIYGLSYLQQDDFYKNIYAWFTMPADFNKLSERPWTVFSAMFTQLRPILLLSNLIWLWTFGYILQDLTGNRKLVPVYLYGGFIGGLIFLLAYNLVPQLESNIGTEVFYGAGTSIVAIAVAATVISPGYRLFPMIGNGIPLWIVTLIFVLVDFAWLSSQPGWFFPHVASALFGLLYAKALQRGKDWGDWMNRLYDWFVNLFNPARPKRRKPPVKQEVFYNTRGKQPYQKKANLTQQKIDEILDKINQRGYDRLTEEEKELLKRASEEDL